MRVYFVRHGQAGTRTAYDALSSVGKQQSRLLGEYFAVQKIQFAAACSGTLQRQRETSVEVAEAYERAGLEFPTIVAVPGWDEFDLDAVYRSLAPVLRDNDEAFRREHEAMLAEIEAAGEDGAARVHRRWTPCDLKVVQAWVSGQYPCEGESWEQFRERVVAQRYALPGNSDDNLIVFTSATPIGVWSALAMDIIDARAMRLAGVLLNSSFTLLEVRGDEFRLHCLNATPHLWNPELRTAR